MRKMRTHIPHFKFIQLLVSDFHSATNQLNKVSYTDLHSYCRWHSVRYPFFRHSLSISHEKVEEVD
jgi:hypothetical protein